MSESPFTPGDLEQLQARGVTAAEAERQLFLLQNPPPPRQLVRACTVGEGIVRIPKDQQEGFALEHERAARQGRVMKFVPASGAATRMFASLIAARSRAAELTGGRLHDEAVNGDTAAREVTRLLEGLPKFAFADDLRAELRFAGLDLDVLANGGMWGEIVGALLDREGLGYAELPKGLLAFHRYGKSARTAFEEHLVEASAYAADEDGVARLRLTVSPEHLSRFEERFADVEGDYARDLGVRFDLTFSTQKPSTDTLAIGADGTPFRDESGRLLFRPSGHGALLENLNDLDGDVVMVKNIDNVVPDRQKGPTLTWKRVLGGYLVTLQRDVFLHVARLRSTDLEPSAVEEAERFIAERLGIATQVAGHATVGSAAASGGVSTGIVPATLDERRREALSILDRPIRVCGVVENRGEPGGGPYWVRLPDGTVAPQIVESAEVDLKDPGQAEIFRTATHFNPVDLVCGVRDAEGNKFDLHRFIDDSASMVTSKSAFGRELRALERPGLWNGAMAFWTTVFVEVPIETFAPVKTIFDLLRPEHQP